MSDNHMIKIADGFTAAVPVISFLGWVWHILPGAVALLASALACTWYCIQISDSPWWKRRHQRKHRRKLRRARSYR